MISTEYRGEETDIADIVDSRQQCLQIQKPYFQSWEFAIWLAYLEWFVLIGLVLTLSISRYRYIRYLYPHWISQFLLLYVRIRIQDNLFSIDNIIDYNIIKYLLIPVNKTGSWGTMLIRERKSSNPMEEISIPSRTILPLITSNIRNNANTKEL